MRERFLNGIASLVCRRSGMIIAIAFLLAFLSSIYAATSLKLNANTDDLIAPDRPFMKTYRQFLDEFGDLEYIYVVVVNNGDRAQTESCVEALTNELRQFKGLPGVYGWIEPEEQLRMATRAMSDDELADFANIADAFPVFLSHLTPGNVVHEARAMMSRLVVSGAGMSRDEQERLGGAAIFLLQAIAAALEDSHSALELAFLLGTDAKREFFTSDTGQFYFITIMPDKDYGTLAVIEEPLRQIREAVSVVQKRFPNHEIGVTGRPILQADEMATTSHDMTRSAILAFVVVAVLYMLLLGGFRQPFFAAIAFACSLAWTYGFITLVIGQLNLLSIVFMLVMVGIGFAFGVHLIARYNEHRQDLSVEESIRLALLTSGPGNMTSAVTTAAVFLLALVTDFLGLRELGLIAGVGLMLCLASMMMVLPALIHFHSRLFHRNDQIKQSGVVTHAAQSTSVSQILTRRPGLVMLITGVLTVGLVVIGGGVRFESNLLNLQARGLESVEWEHRILRDSPSASWFAAVMADDEDEVTDVINQARNYDSIGHVRCVFDLVQTSTPYRDELRTKLHGKRRDLDQLESHELTVTDLNDAADALTVLAVAASKEDESEAHFLHSLRSDLSKLIDEMNSGEAQAQSVRERIEENQNQIAASLETMLKGDQLSLREALPAALRAMFIAPTGRFLVALHPKEDVWNLDAMGQFITDIRKIDPDVTGTPVSYYESFNDMKNAFVMMAILAIFVVTGLVMIDFRRWQDALLVMIPLVIGVIWTVQLMGLLNVSFNLANFFAVPILIGIGVDSSVHILHRHKEGGASRFHLGATRIGVILTALTSMIGFGFLILAAHRGLRSLGLVMAIGSIVCLFASLVILPALLAWLESRRGKSALP